MRASSISVVIPNYNHSNHICDQLDALVAQTLPPLEVVVIDDGSTDDSVGVVGRFARKHPIVRLLRNERNLGVVATLNRGLKEARGELVYFGAADDLVETCLIESVQSLGDRYPRAGLFFGRYRCVDASDHDREMHIGRCSRWDEETYAPPERFLNEYLLVEHCRHTLAPATAYRKRYVEEQGGFRPELGHTCDAFLMRSIGLKYGAAYTPKFLATWRHCPESYSASAARDFRLTLDIVARTVWLMRSPEFRDRFPESYVAKWKREIRSHLFWDHMSATYRTLARMRPGLPPEARGDAGRRGWSLEWPRRLWARFVFSYHWRRMQTYAPDLSCYSAMPR